MAQETLASSEDTIENSFGAFVERANELTLAELEQEAWETIQELDRQIQKWRVYRYINSDPVKRSLADLWIRVCLFQQDNELQLMGECAAVYELYNKHLPTLVTSCISHFLDTRVEDAAKKALMEARLEAGRMTKEWLDQVRRRRRSNINEETRSS